MEAGFELGFKERFRHDRAAIGFEHLERTRIKRGGVPVKADDDGLHKSVARVAGAPKIVVPPIAAMFEIPEDVMLEVIGVIGEGRAAAVQNPAIDSVKQVGIRLRAVRVDALIGQHVVPPIHRADGPTARARPVPMAR